MGHVLRPCLLLFLVCYCSLLLNTTCRMLFWNFDCFTHLPLYHPSSVKYQSGFDSCLPYCLSLCFCLHGRKALHLCPVKTTRLRYSHTGDCQYCLADPRSADKKNLVCKRDRNFVLKQPTIISLVSQGEKQEQDAF